MAYRQLPGQADGPSREPERVQPVPEHYEGVNFPYRGTEQHGVAVPEGAQYDTREFAYPEEAAEVAEPALPEPDPVLVKVVQDSARERLEWRAVRYRVTDQGQRILGRHEKRRGVRIKVHFQTDGVDSKPIYLGYDSGVQPYTGFQLDRGETLFPFTSTEDVWAICNPGESVDISIMYEYAVEL